jgi:hypothetical protein
MTEESWGMPSFADDLIIGIRVDQAACRLARFKGELTPELITAWAGWVGSWTSDWLAFSANACSAVERALVSASQRVASPTALR